MFERFNEPARRTLFFARYETTYLGGMAIEAEHILLGLLRADRGRTPNVFANASLSYTDARDKIRAHLGTREQVPTSVEIPFSDPAKRILQFAAEEATRLNHKHIGNEHLLLGVLREQSSFAAGMLRSHGVTIELLREQIAKSPPDPLFKLETFDPVVSVERIRFLTEELGRSHATEPARGLIDEIHHHLDLLKRHFA